MKQFLIHSLYRFLAFFTRIYVWRHKPVTIGITGTVGKTSCRMVVYDILKKYMEPQEIVYTSPKNFNSELGIMLSIFAIEKYEPGFKNVLTLIIKIIFSGIFGKKKYDVIVLEYGIDHPGDMDFLVSVVKPDISVFTKLDYTHGEFFGSKEDIGHEKFKLMHNTNTKTYLNSQDAFCQSEGENLTIEVKKYFKKKDVSDYKLKVDERGDILAKFKIKRHTITTNLTGNSNAHYIALGFAILKDVGWEPNDRKIRLQLQNQAGRWSFLKGRNDAVLIDSSYNAGPESMLQAIEETCKLQKELFPKHHIGFVLGDMRELGDASEKCHEKIFHAAAQKGCFIVSVGPETKKYFKQTESKTDYEAALKTYLDPRKASEKLGKLLDRECTRHLEGKLTRIERLRIRKDTYILLFKGSQNTIFLEEAIAPLLQNQEDEALLCRQEPYWKEAKEYFFKNFKK